MTPTPTSTATFPCPNFVPPATIGVEDIQAIATHWGQTNGHPNWDARFDLNYDGRIDIIDIMVVTASWGTTCSSTPTPTNVPLPTSTSTPTSTPTATPSPQVGWSANSRVNDDTGTWLQSAPDIAVNTAGDVYAVWEDRRADNALDLYFSYLLPDGTFYPNYRLPTVSTDMEPAIGADGSGNVHIAFQRTNGGRWEVWARYRDAGGGWSIFPSISGITTANQTIPNIAVDALGNAALIWTGSRTTGGADVYSSYRATGSTWQPPVRVNDTPGSSYGERPSLAVDAAGNAYAVWIDTRDGVDSVYFSYRSVSGVWSANVRVNDMLATSMTPAIAVDSLGNAHVTWSGLQASTHRILFDSTPHNGNWGADVEIASGPGVRKEPAIAVSPNGENLCIVWKSDQANPGYDLFGRFWASGVWDATTQINDVSGSVADNSNSQHPTVGMDNQGRTHVLWADDRNVVYPGAVYNFDIYYSRHTSQ